jgi:hypothetical protein
METRRRWEEGQGEEGYFGQKIIERSLMFNKYGMLLMNLYGWTTIIIRVSHSSTNISMFSKKSLIVDTPHHTFYHKNKNLHKTQGWQIYAWRKGLHFIFITDRRFPNSTITKNDVILTTYLLKLTKLHIKFYHTMITKVTFNLTRLWPI